MSFPINISSPWREPDGLCPRSGGVSLGISGSVFRSPPVGRHFATTLPSAFLASLMPPGIRATDVCVSWCWPGSCNTPDAAPAQFVRDLRGLPRVPDVQQEPTTRSPGTYCASDRHRPFSPTTVSTAMRGKALGSPQMRGSDLKTSLSRWGPGLSLSPPLLFHDVPCIINARVFPTLGASLLHKKNRRGLRGSQM